MFSSSNGKDFLRVTTAGSHEKISTVPSSSCTFLKNNFDNERWVREERSHFLFVQDVNPCCLLLFISKRRSSGADLSGSEPEGSPVDTGPPRCQDGKSSERETSSDRSDLRNRKVPVTRNPTPQQRACTPPAKSAQRATLNQDLG